MPGLLRRRSGRHHVESGVGTNPTSAGRTRGGVGVPAPTCEEDPGARLGAIVGVPERLGRPLAVRACPGQKGQTCAPALSIQSVHGRCRPGGGSPGSGESRPATEPEVRSGSAPGRDRGSCRGPAEPWPAEMPARRPLTGSWPGRQFRVAGRRPSTPDEIPGDLVLTSSVVTGAGRPPPRSVRCLPAGMRTERPRSRRRCCGIEDRRPAARRRARPEGVADAGRHVHVARESISEGRACSEAGS